MLGIAGGKTPGLSHLCNYLYLFLSHPILERIQRESKNTGNVISIRKTQEQGHKLEPRKGVYQCFPHDLYINLL